MGSNFVWKWALYWIFTYIYTAGKHFRVEHLIFYYSKYWKLEFEQNSVWYGQSDVLRQHWIDEVDDVNYDKTINTINYNSSKGTKNMSNLRPWLFQTWPVTLRIQE